jgi:hypothetical protein
MVFAMTREIWIFGFVVINNGSQYLFSFEIVQCHVEVIEVIEVYKGNWIILIDHHWPA